MRYTNYALRIYEALESGGWRSGAEIADLIATPHKSLKTALERLITDGVIERNANRSPTQYRRTPEPRGAAAEAAKILAHEIARERVPDSVRIRRSDPEWTKLAEGAIGYCGIVLPQENHFHGFFIRQMPDSVIDPLISMTRAAITDDPEDRKLVGAFASAIISVAAGHFGRDAATVTGRLGPFLAALRKVSGKSYFILTGERDGDQYLGRYQFIPDEQITMAQVVMQQTPSEFIAGMMDKMPEVAGIKQRRAIIQGMN